MEKRSSLESERLLDLPKAGDYVYLNDEFFKIEGIRCYGETFEAEVCVVVMKRVYKLEKGVRVWDGYSLSWNKYILAWVRE